MNKTTKDILLESGYEIFLQKGYHGAGLNDILKHAGVPKGSFYHYFENKEAFLIEVLDFYLHAMSEQITPFLNDTTQPALKNFETLMRGMIEKQKSGGCQGGCLMGNIAQELCDDSDLIADAVQKGFQAWIDVISEFFERAKKDESLVTNSQSKALANMFADGWQGAMLRMKVEKSTEPLHRFLDVFLGILST